MERGRGGGRNGRWGRGKVRTERHRSNQRQRGWGGVGGEIKRNKSEEGLSRRETETEEEKGVKEKESVSDCFTGSF